MNMMNTKTFIGLSAGLLAISLPFGAFAADETQPRTQRRAPSAGGQAEQMIAQWPARPKLGAQMMISQYGQPQEATAERLVWHNQGPYKRITVTKQEHHHDFPLPHTDFMEHTVAYKVPADKVDELSAFDGSATFDRTKGELSARCDLEGHNILTLNIANDVLTGKKDAKAARKAFGDIVVEDVLGKHPAYVTALQFQPPTSAEFSDQPTIPGAAVRPGASGQASAKGSQGEGEVLALLNAVNLNEVTAAMVASKKKVNSQVADYAKMLHQEHGKNMQQTMQLGQKINVTPVITPAVDALKTKGAGELATIVPLEGEQFGQAYIQAMIKGHTEALQMIDSQLIPKAQNQQLKQHLTQTRQHVAAHLQAAQQLQGGSAVGATGADSATQTGKEATPQQRPRSAQEP